MSQLDWAKITESRRQAEQVSGLHFSAWVGESGGDSRAHAERLHAGLPEPERSVYLACDVSQHTIEIVTGRGARQTLTDEECQQATTRMRAALAEGDVSGALVQGLSHLGTYAID